MHSSVNRLGMESCSKEYDLSATGSLKFVRGRAGMHCKNCGCSLRRVSRRGFLQKRVYTFFGYYPWECPICRETVFIRKQYQGKRRHEHKAATSD